MTIQPQNESSKERTIREALEAALAPGETLLEYTEARESTAIWFGHQYWIGLTGERLIFLKAKKRDRVYSIGYEFIASLTHSSKRNGALHILQLDLGSVPGEPSPKARLTLSANILWSANFADLVKAFDQARAARAERPSQPISVQQFIQQIRDLQDMEMWSAAEALTKARLERDVYIQADEDVQALHRQVSSGKLAVRVAAIIFGIVLLFLIWFALQGQATLGCGMILAIVAVVNLLRGSPGARGLALALALLSAGVNLLLNAVGNSLLDVLVWGSFGLAMGLLLIGRPSRRRTLLGAAVFGVGSVGLYAFYVLALSNFPGAVAWLAPGGNNPVSEDFSDTRYSSWTTYSDTGGAVKLEMGGYSIMVKKANMIYFGFPPTTYSPARGEVDARVVGNYTQALPGDFGMVCRYQQDGGKYYVAYVDVYGGGYVVERIEGTDDFPLTDPFWQEADGLKAPDQVNRIGLSCQDNQLSLTINGVQQPVVSDPAMAQFGDGYMGFFASTSYDVPPGGFKVLFDNASFWPK